MNKNDITTLKDLYTHAGVFHADDLFSTALLWHCGCKAEIHRVNKVPDDLDETALVYDIGMGKFDHHQINKAVRDNGVPYAAFGLLMRDLWPLLMTSSQYDWLDKTFIQEVDAADNGTAPSALSRTISSFNKNWNEDNSPESVRAAFDKAASVCSEILNRIIFTAEYDNSNVEQFGLIQVCTQAFLNLVGSNDSYASIARVPNKGIRKNGIPYGCFGYAVKKYRNRMFGRMQDYLEFDKTFVQDIDAVEAGTAKSILEFVVHAFNPIPNFDFYYDKGRCPKYIWKALMQSAVEVFMECIKHVVQRIHASYHAEEISLEAAESAHGGVAFLDRYVPVRRYLADDPRVNWIGYPSMRGGYSLATFRDSQGNDKALHPAQFCGLPEEQLPEGMTFCHPDGFIAEFVDQVHAEIYAEEYLFK